MAKQIQVDRERENMRRGLQYRRSIQLYYRKFHAYPPNLEALVKTNNIRFLRKKYVDLSTNKDEWKPILFGQNKVPVAMGFFGEAMKGTTLAGTGPTGGNSPTQTGATNGNPTASNPDPGASSGSSAFGSSSSSSGFGSGQTFGGAGIIGFEPRGTRQSILIYKKKNHYNEWEFTYDPISDQKMMSNNTGNIGTSAASTSNAIGSPTPTPSQ
jgi:hypothetical protein